MKGFKKRLNDEILTKLSVRRVVIYLLGLFILALGVSFSVKSRLGVSPVNSIPYTVSILTGIEQGLCTSVIFTLLIFLQLLISPRTFSPFAFLQIICSFVFGWFVTLSNLAISFIPEPEEYWLRLVFTAVGVLLVAVGVFLYVGADLLMLPGEGVMTAMSQRTKLSFPACKMIFDCSMVAGAVILSLAFTGTLLGVREGTVIAAIGVGLVMKPIAGFFKVRLQKLLDK